MKSATNNLSEKPDNLPGALARIRSAEVGCFEAPLRELRYAGGHSLKIGLDTHELDSDAWFSLCRYLALPADLLPLLGPHLGDIVLKTLNAEGRHAPDAPEEARLSYNSEGGILALTPSNLVCVSNSEIVQVVEETIPANILSEALCARLVLTEAAFEIDIYTRQSAVEPRPGDTLCGGVHIRHSQAGSFPTVVLGYIHRLVCTNGMTQRVCLAGKPARTRRSKAQNAKASVLRAIHDQIQGAFDQLRDRLDGVVHLTRYPLDAEGLPEALRRRWSINKDVAAEIAAALNHDELGRSRTEYDLANALSRVATHSPRLAPRYRRHLALAAGMFAQRHVHRCPQCGTWLHGEPRN